MIITGPAKVLLPEPGEFNAESSDEIPFLESYASQKARGAIEVLPPSHPEEIGPPRAGVPAVWGEYRSKVDRLLAAAAGIVVADETEVERMAEARTMRLQLRALRIAVDKTRKHLGEEAYRRKVRIDQAAKELRELLEPAEARLLEAETFAERAETKRLDVRHAERVAAMSALGFSAPLMPALREMSDADYEAARADAATAQAARVAAAEAAAKAEAEAALAKHRAERALRDEAKAAAASLAAERERVDALEREKAARIQAERDLAAKLAAEQAAAQEQERQRLARLAAAPDAAKLAAFLAEVRALQAPVFSGPAYVALNVAGFIKSAADILEKRGQAAEIAAPTTPASEDY